MKELNIPFLIDKNVVEVNINNKFFIIKKKENGYKNYGESSKDDVYYDMYEFID